MTDLGTVDRRTVRLALDTPGVLTTTSGHGKSHGSVDVFLALDADRFRRALWAASFQAFTDYQRQLARDSLRVTVERTERKLFGYQGAHRGEDR
jgi:hypothetical protein